MQFKTLIRLCTFLFVVRLSCPVTAQIEITPDVIYGHKSGLAMTFDVFHPKDANGKGVLFMVSGGWYSTWIPPEAAQGFFAPLLNEGFAIFAVRHGSSPEFGIPEAVADVRRAVRYIRLNADDFRVDPNRLGVYGASAGGHLSLMLGTASDDGDPDHQDPVERISDRVQAVVALVPPTDLKIMVSAAIDRLPAYDQFPALELSMDEARAHSPIEYVTPDDAPTLLLAGVKDDLVPVEHSRSIHAEFDRRKVENKLVEYADSGHGFTPQDLVSANQELAAWFRRHLLDHSPTDSE